MAEEEFVSVAEAAAKLGVSDRTARRMAGQLADTDREPDNGHGRRVRLSAMAALRETPVRPDSVAGQNPDNVRPDTTDTAARTRPVAVRLTDADLRAAVAEAQVVELRERVAASEKALGAALETVAIQARQLAEADARLASVLAVTGRLNLTPRDQAAEASEPETGQGAAEQARAASEGPQGDRAEKTGESDTFEPIAIPVPEGATEPQDGREGASPQPEPTGGQTGRVEAGGGDSARRPSWWARLWGRA